MAQKVHGTLTPGRMLILRGKKILNHFFHDFTTVTHKNLTSVWSTDRHPLPRRPQSRVWGQQGTNFVPCPLALTEEGSRQPILTSALTTRNPPHRSPEDPTSLTQRDLSLEAPQKHHQHGSPLQTGASSAVTHVPSAPGVSWRSPALYSWEDGGMERQRALPKATQCPDTPSCHSSWGPVLPQS